MNCLNAPSFRKRRRQEMQPGNGELDSGGDPEERPMHIEEKALVALIEHRSKEVEHLRNRLSYYKSELEAEEKRLGESQQKLAQLRRKNSVRKFQTHVDEPRQDPDLYTRKLYRISPKPAITFWKSETSYTNKLQIKPRSETLDIKQEDVQEDMVTDSVPNSFTCPSSSADKPGLCNLKGEQSQRTFNEKEMVDDQDKGETGTSDKKVQKDLISMISRYSSPCTIKCQTCAVVSSQHKRKMRSLVLCPCNEKLFATSALDGAVNLWKLQDSGSSAVLISTANCLSPKKRRWPEDVAWHPEGNSILSVYTADGEESQISIWNLNEPKESSKVRFLEEIPHVKGIINSIMFMPWEVNSFATGGSDHAVIFWSEKERENSFKPHVLHKTIHSSAVMGVSGLQQKNIVMSAGADKRIVGFDLIAERVEYKHQLESKCMSVLPNPCDLNLFMVQTGTLEKQLRLFDIRARQTEVHSLGWKQESSETQSALIQQSWSPNGLYISSGSMDPVIHIFDIRYKSHKPSQSINAHQKRVFKAVWHPTLPLLISISSDLNIGLHRTD